MSDNLGIIISAAYCLADDVVSCAVIPDGILVNLKSSAEWIDFKAIPGKIDISVEENTSSGISVYSVGGKIRVPRQQFANTPEMIKFRYKKILIRYVTGNGDIMVVGDKENPIKVTHKVINPSGTDTASGVEYYASGTMKHPELPLL